MAAKHEPFPEPSSDALVGKRMIAAAVRAAAEREPCEQQELVASEPLLSGFLRDGVLTVVGKLSLAGAGTEIVETVAEDVCRLVNVAACSVRNAYRELLNDLLPDPDAGAANQKPGQTLPPSSGD